MIWSGGPIEADELEAEALAWLNEFRYELSAQTTCRRLATLRNYGKWAHVTDFLSDYIAPTPARPQPHPLPEGIGGVISMIEACNTRHHKALIALCGLVGLRVSEALAVKCSDFNYDNSTLVVRGKGDKSRVVPVSKVAWTHIQNALVMAMMNGTDALVVPIQDRSARELITRAGKKAGISRSVSSHDLRSTLLTHAYATSLDLRAVQEIAGHANSATTESYTQITTGTMRAAVEV